MLARRGRGLIRYKGFWLAVVCDIMAVMIPLLCVSRFQLILAVGMAVFTYISMTGSFSLIYVGVLLVALIPAYVALTVLRSHSVEYLNGIFEMKNSHMPIFITQPYMYIANNYDNFNCLVEALPEHSLGLKSLFPLWALTGLKFFFPQLIVGPIVKYREMADQLHDGANRCTPARAEHGAELFVFGLAKKVILADSIGALWTDIIGAGGVGLTNVSTPLAWLGIIAYSLQLYFDFAGYSEMSNGLAALLGFDCPANFNLPYISGSITEFWRRWHITLSGWFRDYIYIPLGGNRKGQARQLLNMFLVWAATGIWHGASWNFIAWGLYYFVLLTIEKNFLLKYLKKGKVWPHIYTLFFVVLGWGIFTANQPGAPLGLLLQKLFVPQGGISPVYYLRNYGVLLVLGCVCSSALPHWLWEKISKNTVAKLLVFALLTALCVCYVVAATNATALYANF